MMAAAVDGEEKLFLTPGSSALIETKNCLRALRIQTKD